MSKTKTAEELTKEMKKGTGRKRIRDSKRQKIALEMASEGIKISEIAQKLGYTMQHVLMLMRKNNIATRSKMAELLEAESDNTTIANQTNWKVEAVERFREERNKKQANKQEIVRKRIKDSKRQEKVVEMASEGIKASEIARELGYTSQISVLTLMRRNNIATRRQVAKLLKVEPDNAKIASQTNWKIEAVEKFREEKQGKKIEVETNEPKIEPVQRTDRKEFFEMARQATDISEMAKQLETTEGTVRFYLTQYGFWDREQIVESLRLSDEQIAQRGKIDIEVVKSIRAQEKAKLEREVSSTAQENRLTVQRKEALRKRAEQRAFYAKAGNYASIKQWNGRTGVSEFEIVIELRKLRKRDRASSHQLQLLKDWENENILRLPKQKRTINLTIEWRNYRREVEKFDIGTSESIKDGIKFTNQRLLALYEELLDEVKYAYMCLGYIKIRQEFLALELAEQKLGLNRPTLSELKEKIEEILAREKEQAIKNQKPEAPTGGAGGER